MIEIIKEVEINKMILSVSKEIYEKDAVINASYKYTDKCFLKIEQIKNNFEIIFETKIDNTNLKEIALDFANEILDQQVRINCGREYKLVREEIVKKAFRSIEKKYEL